MNNSNSKFDVKDIVYIAFMAAVVFVATFMIQIPTPTGGYVNVGDPMVFLAAILLGGRKGAIAAAIGGCLSDSIGGYYIYAPFTLVIKAGMALIVGAIIYRNSSKVSSPLNNIFAFVSAGIFEVVAYFGAGIVAYYFTGSPHLSIAVIKSTADVFGNIIQAGFGVIVAVPLVTLLNKNSFFLKIKRIPQ